MSEDDKNYRPLTAADGNFQGDDEISNHVPPQWIRADAYWAKEDLPQFAIKAWTEGYNKDFIARRPLKEGEAAPLEVKVDPGLPELGDHHAKHVIAPPAPDLAARLTEGIDGPKSREEVHQMLIDEANFIEQIRDEFAMHAIYEASQHVGGEREPSAIARRAYRIADAMLKERQPKPKDEEIPF